MTKKDFKLIAQTVRSLPFAFQVKKEIAEAFAATLTTTNSLFDRHRFVEACTAWDS